MVPYAVTLPTTVMSPVLSRRILLTPLYANVRFVPAAVTVQSWVPPVTVITEASVGSVSVGVVSVGVVSVGLAEGAFVSICVWIADVTPVT